MISEQVAREECANLGDVWEALSKVTADLKQRGVNVPPDIYTSLRGTKDLITLCKSHPKLADLVPGDIDAHDGFCVACCGADIVARIRCELRNVEDLLIIKATNELGSRSAMDLQDKMRKAWEPARRPVVALEKD